jgi:hypothetical protein
MVKWSRICRSKCKEGSGVKDLKKQNISLLCKWWWKLETENCLWQQIVKEKYLRNKSVVSVKPCVHDSPGWKTLSKGKEQYFAGRKVILSKWNLVRFWIDPWLGNKPLSETCPALFAICHGQYWTFEKVLSCDFDVPFRRLLPNMAVQWDFIKSKALSRPMSNVSDVVTWNLSANGVFSTKSMYQHLKRNLAGSHNKWIWKEKIPLKIKISFGNSFECYIDQR